MNIRQYDLKLKIIFLPAYFFPEHAASPYISENRNQAFADAGFEMVVYAPTPTRGVNDEVRQEYKHRLNETLYNGQMKVRRFSLMREGKNPVKRALRYFIGCLKQLCYGIFSKEARSCDVMLISSTPPIQGAMAALIKKFRHIPFVYNLQDIFPDSLVGTGMTHKGSLLWKVGRVIENFTYRNADKIVVISQDFKRNIMAKGVPEEKIEVIYNWVDEKEVTNVERADNVLFDRYHLSREKFYITYCGNIGLTQNMDLLMECAKELSEMTEIQFVLVGEGADKPRVQERVQNEQIENITFLPFQPYSEISHVFSLGDIGLIISKPGVGMNSLPSKTWSIMSAGRPVVANFDENELKDIITDNHCGIFTKAGDKESFKEAILSLYHSSGMCAEYGRNGRLFVENNLTKEIGTRKWKDVIKRFNN